MMLPLLAAATLGAACPAASGPAVLVDVVGLKDRSGQVRVRVFGGATETYFDKRQVLKRIEVPVPAAGRVSFCVPVPRPGLYAVDVRHDTNMNGKTDRSDGGGASGNPKVGLLDVIFGRKPDPRKVQVQVGNGAAPVPITVLYLQGGAFRPWSRNG
jgi:uncharacterized protein (DUF2141 family)